MPGKGRIEKLNVPEFLTYESGRKKFPVFFIDFKEHAIDIESAAGADKANSKIHEVLNKILKEENFSSCLIKIHPGEPKSRTYTIPRLMESQADFSRGRGVEPVLGDSTVIYTGGRGHKSNPRGDFSAYMRVVDANGWGKDKTGLDFVVIDRPESSVEGVFSFTDEEIFREIQSPGVFKSVYVSGGFEEAGVVLNNAHLTMHGMSPLALSVKSLTMGCAGVSGKKQMHMNLTPSIESSECKKCGLCVKSCPVGALARSDEGVPTLLAEKCVGCGECLAVCPAGAIRMFHSGGITWGRGKDSFVARMSDFLMSMMNGKWGGLVNLGHLYRITAQCDCMDIVQKPVMEDIGIILSRNPFAADRLAEKLFSERAGKEGKYFDLGDYAESFRYVERVYDIITEPEIIRV